MALSTFHQHLLDNLTATQMDNLVGDIEIKSYHRLNHIFRKPQNATLDEILFFATILKVSAYSLVDTYDMGRSTMGPRAIIFLMNQHDDKKSTVNGTVYQSATT